MEQSKTPSRHGQRWDALEVDDLRWEWCAGYSIGQIAARHKRLVNAIECRLAKEGFWDQYAAQTATDSFKVPSYVKNVDISLVPESTVKKAYLQIYQKLRGRADLPLAMIEGYSGCTYVPG